MTKGGRRHRKRHPGKAGLEVRRAPCACGRSPVRTRARDRSEAPGWREHCFQPRSCADERADGNRQQTLNGSIRKRIVKTYAAHGLGRLRDLCSVSHRKPDSGRIRTRRTIRTAAPGAADVPATGMSCDMSPHVPHRWRDGLRVGQSHQKLCMNQSLSSMPKMLEQLPMAKGHSGDANHSH